MDKGFVGYILIFLLLSAAAVAFAGVDQITPTIAQAQAEQAMGATTYQAVEGGASLLVKLLIGGVVAGVAGAAFAEFRKWYATWKRNSKRKRWQGGPNAQWKGQSPSMPKLTRDDLMLLALSGQKLDEGQRPSPRRGAIRAQDEEEDAELEMPL